MGIRGLLTLLLLPACATTTASQDTPAWLDRAVIYGAAPRLLGDQGLERLRARLDTIQAMGVDTLWLSPIHPTPEGDYGYAVLDPLGVAEDLGGEQALRALIDDAHGRGMRVLLDFVPNHTSDAHAYFRHAEQFGERSPYYDFYQRDADGRPVHYFTWDNLPNLDYDHPEVRRWMGEALAHWVREFDVDGFRIDVAWGVHGRAPEFFADVRRELRRIKSDVVLIAEATARDPNIFLDGFDAAYDWTRNLGEWAWGEAFPKDGTLDLQALHRALTADGTDLSKSARVVRFLNNNDTGQRFVTRHGIGRTRVAYAMMFTLPGIPTLFMGDGSLEPYHPYNHEEPLHLEPDPRAHAWIARWAALRREHPALREGALVHVPVAGAAARSVYAYLRVLDGQPPLLVVLNFDDAPQSVDLELPTAWRDQFEERLELPAHAAWLVSADATSPSLRLRLTAVSK